MCREDHQSLTEYLQVLAMGIVIVFVIGLVKLWVANRHVRRLEELDAEKQARVVQIRKSGLSASGKSRLGTEIPFGVKALESGIEVDGIWVARMASMATRPPERRWNSRRKVRATPASLVETSDLGVPGQRTRRGSKGSKRAGAGNISRREIMEPSERTRDKLENLSLLEEEPQSRGPTDNNKDRVLAETADHEQSRAHHRQKSTLGKLQRGLKRMTSLETWQDPRDHQVGEPLDAREFQENARAKKPQRIYPTSPKTTAVAASTTTPLVAPQARSQGTRERAHSSSAHGMQPVDEAPAEAPRQARRNSSTSNQSFALRQANALRQHVSNDSNDPAYSSADSFVTSAEVPKESPPRSQQPAPQKRVSSESGRGLRERPDIGPRRSSLRNSQDRARRLSTDGRPSLDRTTNAAQATPLSAEVPAHRYPPNSSRSGPSTRRHSSTQQQEQQQPTESTLPNPTAGPGEM